LQTIAENVGTGVLSALQSPQPPPSEAVLISLINEIAGIPDQIVLVLDDCHLIDAQPIHDVVAFLLEHLPPRLHLVIATREDPHLSLTRLRARGQLTELRAPESRFSSSKVAEFLNRVMGLDLSAEDIAALETRAEGWIAGLHLAAISLQGHQDVNSRIRSFTGFASFGHESNSGLAGTHMGGTRQTGCRIPFADELGLDVDGELVPLHDFDYVVLARILIAQRRLDEASRAATAPA
jgi:LuxR family maltose regulon positive regulatory protein